jgi:hypothetical protein
MYMYMVCLYYVHTLYKILDFLNIMFFLNRKVCDDGLLLRWDAVVYLIILNVWCLSQTHEISEINSIFVIR